MNITISGQQLEFNFRFSEVAKLEEHCPLGEMEAFVQKVKNAPLILSIGTGKSLEECVAILDAGTFEDVQTVIKAFSEVIVKWLVPNSPTPTN